MISKLIFGPGLTEPLPPGCSALWDFEASALDGKVVPLSSFAGRVALVVNTASQCGFTRQYSGLERVWRRYSDAGLVVMGFPSNDFGGQEPGSNSDIREFCSLNFGVTFPLFSKAPVKGAQKQPVFRFLTEEGPRPLRGEVRWNFEKFLVDRQGRLVGRWRSMSSPESKRMISAIEAVLRRDIDRV